MIHPLVVQTIHFDILKVLRIVAGEEDMIVSEVNWPEQICTKCTLLSYVQ